MCALSHSRAWAEFVPPRRQGDNGGQRIPRKTKLMPIQRMSDLDLSGKRVLIREDLNVPVKDGKVTSEQRILAALPTIRLALEKGAAVMVTSHLGRPKEG